VAENNGKTKVSVSLYEKGQNPPKPVTAHSVKTNVFEGGGTKTVEIQRFGGSLPCPEGWLRVAPAGCRKQWKNKGFRGVAQ
jgi:hypothetical protein